MKSKDEFVRDMHSKLDRWSGEIDSLTAKANQVASDVRAEYDSQIAALKAKQAAARGKLEELQRASDGAWADAKTGIEMAWDAIEQAIDSAKSRFK